MSDSKPKIAYFLRRDPGEVGQITGGTWSNLMVLRALTNVDVLVVTNQSDVVTEELSRVGIRHIVLGADLSYSGVRGHPVRLVRALASTALFNARFFRTLRREGIAVVQCDENAATFVGFGAKLAGCALVVVYRNFPGVVPKTRALYKIPTLIADRLVTTAQALHEAVLTQGWRSPASRTEFVYNSVDLGAVRERRAGIDRAKVRAELGIAEGEVAMGVIASIVPVKQQAEFLEEVVPGLAPELERRNARIYLVGGGKDDDAYPARCKRAIEVHGLERVVRMVGYARDMAPWYAALDISVYPGIEGPARSLIESSAHELPIVARAGCAEAVLDGKTGLLCATLGEMGAPILRLVSDAALRRELGSNGRAFVEDRFDVRRNSGRYEAIYAALARHRPSY